jgi:hypothetical protein
MTVAARADRRAKKSKNDPQAHDLTRENLDDCLTRNSFFPCTSNTRRLQRPALAAKAGESGLPGAARCLFLRLPHRVENCISIDMEM